MRFRCRLARWLAGCIAPTLWIVQRSAISVYFRRGFEQIKRQMVCRVLRAQSISLIDGHVFLAAQSEQGRAPQFAR